MLKLMKLIFIYILRYYGPLILLRGLWKFMILALHPLPHTSWEAYSSLSHTARTFLFISGTFVVGTDRAVYLADVLQQTAFPYEIVYK